MKLYSVQFTGHYPVGAVAVVLAADKPQAKTLFETALKEEGLLEGNGWLESLDWEKEFVQIPQTQPKAVILLDGNY